jgi:hypothetical protein
MDLKTMRNPGSATQALTSAETNGVIDQAFSVWDFVTNLSVIRMARGKIPVAGTSCKKTQLIERRFYATL